MKSVLMDAKCRHDFLLLFDVIDGNPNGDPDAGNLPRVDPETMQGLVSDVALKRKVRDWVAQTQDATNMKIYVEHRGILYNQQQLAYEALDKEPDDDNRDTVEAARQWMCRNFYDVRAFGAVMSVKRFNCGQVRGPVQLTFARSIDPVVPLDLSITRVAVTRTEETKETEMGRKPLIPYGLYMARGFFNPFLATDTGFDDNDLSVLWQALERMWDFDRSASRGFMDCRGLYVFSHESVLGNGRASKLFGAVSVARKPAVQAPRSFQDYEVTVDSTAIPAGVTLTVLAD